MKQRSCVCRSKAKEERRDASRPVTRVNFSGTHREEYSHVYVGAIMCIRTIYIVRLNDDDGPRVRYVRCCLAGGTLTFQDLAN